MTTDTDPDCPPRSRRRPAFDRWDIACLAWAGLFAVVTGVLALLLS
jgi:hypothetical protein